MRKYIYMLLAMATSGAAFAADEWRSPCDIVILTAQTKLELMPKIRDYLTEVDGEWYIIEGPNKVTSIVDSGAGVIPPTFQQWNITLGTHNCVLPLD